MERLEETADRADGVTWMFPDASFDDLGDVFEGLGVVLLAVVAQGDVVGQS